MYWPMWSEKRVEGDREIIIVSETKSYASTRVDNIGPASRLKLRDLRRSCTQWEWNFSRQSNRWGDISILNVFSDKNVIVRIKNAITLKEKEAGPRFRSVLHGGP